MDAKLLDKAAAEGEIMESCQEEASSTRWMHDTFRGLARIGALDKQNMRELDTDGTTCARTFRRDEALNEMRYSRI